MANEKDFTKMIAGILGAGIAGAAVTAAVKSSKSSRNKMNKENSDLNIPKTSEEIFEEERIRQEMDDMWNQKQMDDMWEEHAMMQQSTYDFERINMANNNNSDILWKNPDRLSMDANSLPSNEGRKS